jgi:hypothetical protein
VFTVASAISKQMCVYEDLNSPRCAEEPTTFEKGCWKDLLG